MGCIALVRCVLVLRCGLAGVVWHPDAISTIIFAKNGHSNRVVFQPTSGCHTTPAKPQRNTNTHRTRAI